MRNLRSPAVPRLLDREDLWSAEFALLYQAHCDELIFSEPAEGLRLAQLGMMLAARVESSDVRARAYAILGSGLRAARNARTAAEEAYQQALRLARKPLVRADVQQRYARLLTEMGRGQEGLRAADDAIRLFRATAGNLDDGDARFAVPDAQSEPTGLVIRGWIYLELADTARALEDFSRALELADPIREPRTHESALQNTAYLILGSGSIDQLDAVLSAVRALRRRYSRSRHRVVPKYMLLWLEGLIHWRLGLDRRAETLLSRAREGLAEKGSPSSVLQVSLDLLRFYLEAGDDDRADTVCNEMLELAQVTDSGTEIAAMLRLLASRPADMDRILSRIRSIF